ncbi:MAG: sulfotransferase [Deltaproteobacteria bacterium]|nr:sulfotransferase [Deltaproteobacteria bacterium]
MNREHPPIFVIGVDRSGTTLLSLMLDSHSRIAIPYESHFFLKYYKNRTKLVGDLTNPETRLAVVTRILQEPYVRKWDQKLSPEEIPLKRCNSLEEMINEIYLAYAKHFGKDIWGDKTPEYIKDIHILNKMFPSCKFVHIIRDGRDVALSIVDKWWGASDFMTAIRYWAYTVSCARKMLEMLPDDRYIELTFEDLVHDPEKQLSRIMEFLGLTFEANMLTNYTQKASLKVGSDIDQHHVHLTEKPSSSQAFKWKKNLRPCDQAVAFEIAGEVLTKLGYEAGVKAHPFKVLRKAYHRLKESYTWRVRNRINMD